MPKEQIIDHVTRQFREADQILTVKSKDPTGNSYPQRWIFKRMEKYINGHLNKLETPRWLVVPGLRGVGKSTLMAQLYVNLLKGLDINFIYFSLDEVVETFESSLQEVLSVYEFVSGINLATCEKPIFIFLDEVHYDAKWRANIKVLFDKNPNIFVIATGSSALGLLHKTTDEERRIVIEPLFPMTFGEYMSIKNKKLPIKGFKDKVKNILFNSSNANEVYGKLKFLEPQIDQYWSDIREEMLDNYLGVGSLPFANNFFDKFKAYDAVYQTIRAIVDIDLPQIAAFRTETIKTTIYVLSLLAASSSISLRKLANETGLKADTVSQILDALEQAELLIRIYPYGGITGRISPNNPSKYYFMSPALRASILNVIGGATLIDKSKGQLFEDTIAMYLYREYISKGIAQVSHLEKPGEVQADFVLELPGKKIPIEVGYGKKDTRQIWPSIAECKAPYGLIISSRELKVEQENAVFVPYKWFLMM
jgi:hypothetical protein